MTCFMNTYNYMLIGYHVKFEATKNPTWYIHFNGSIMLHKVEFPSLLNMYLYYHILIHALHGIICFSLFLPPFSRTDHQMAENRACVHCRSSCSGNRSDHLANFTSSNKKEAVQVFLPSAPLVYGFHPVLLAACWSWAFLFGNCWCSSICSRQNSTYHTVKERNMSYFCTHTAMQSSRTHSSKASG